jgi:hypothetical protein
MGKGLDISVLVAARDEYIEQLKCILAPLIIQGVNSIYQDALNVSEGKKTIWQFQQFLKEVLTWNQTILQQESIRIKKKCPYIMDIVTAIFVSNVKILASIRLKGDSDNIKVKIPTCEIFVHSVYIESAQQIFYDPMLFYHKNGDFNEIQKNKKYVREIIYSAIDESIRKMMPFDHILQEYLKNALNDNAEYTDSESEEEEDENEETLDNKKVIEEENEENQEENENEEENEEDTTKNLHINGLNSYEIPKAPEQNAFGSAPAIPPAMPPQPPSYPEYNQGGGSENGSSGSDLSEFSDSDSEGSYSSGSYSGSDSDSSDGKHKERSEHRERSEHSERREHKEHRERSEHHKHHREGSHDKHHRDKKDKYSFF